MSQKNTLQSLISTSGEDQFQSLPIFYQGKIIKRISKEEIQGWSQNTHRQAFQKKQIQNLNKRKQNHLKPTPALPEKFQYEVHTSPPSLRSIKKQLNHYNETTDLFQGFKTMNQLPKNSLDLVLPKVKCPQQPKEDYVRGRKLINLGLRRKEITVLRPIPKLVTVSLDKTNRDRSKSISVREQKKRSSKQGQIAIICYPLDINQNKEEEKHLQYKLYSFMRKYQI